MRKLNKKRGQGLVEYALLIALLALTCVLAMTSLGDQIVAGFYKQIQGNLENAEKIITPPAPSDAPSETSS